MDGEENRVSAELGEGFVTCPQGKGGTRDGIVAQCGTTEASQPSDAVARRRERTNGSDL